ncbi:MAG: endonuclease III [Phycisphaerae bacterium]|nr:endonuclease III [Phycisphaerae bacterium]
MSDRRGASRWADETPITGLPFALPQTTPAERARARRLLAALDAAYPNATCALRYTNARELLIATILSAQTTDAAVNKATPALFARFPTPADYAAASPGEIEPYVRSLGFFRNKARAIHESMRAIVERHGGQVPRTMHELLALRGVARKTANVVLGTCFGVNDGVVVDTHVQRLSRRLALAPAGATPEAIERRLMALFPREAWCRLSHLLIAHGRSACPARGATCEHAICRRFGKACEARRAQSPPVRSAAAPGLGAKSATRSRVAANRRSTAAGSSRRGRTRGSGSSPASG